MCPKPKGCRMDEFENRNAYARTCCMYDSCKEIEKIFGITGFSPNFGAKVNRYRFLGGCENRYAFTVVRRIIKRWKQVSPVGLPCRLLCIVQRRSERGARKGGGKITLLSTLRHPGWCRPLSEDLKYVVNAVG